MIGVFGLGIHKLVSEENENREGGDDYDYEDGAKLMTMKITTIQQEERSGLEKGTIQPKPNDLIINDHDKNEFRNRMRGQWVKAGTT